MQAYATLAHHGVFRPLTIVRAKKTTFDDTQARRIFSPEVSSIVSSILSDPHARRREFGSGGLLRFPVQTAIKTGTSTDYRDAWAVGYSENFTVGVWMGNLNRSSMHEITGARGPALVLRSVFAELERTRETKPLFESPTLIRQTVCSLSGNRATSSCPRVEERFIPGTEPSVECSHEHLSESPSSPVVSDDQPHRAIQIVIPTPGLHIARDPRIPDEQEALGFEVSSEVDLTRIHWLLDGKEIATTLGNGKRLLWNLQPGHHELRVLGERIDSSAVIESESVGFLVK